MRSFILVIGILLVGVVLDGCAITGNPQCLKLQEACAVAVVQCLNSGSSEDDAALEERPIIAVD